MNFLIAHQTAGRTRLRAQLRPVDELELMTLAEAVGALPGVEAVDWRPGTGSLVIEHPEAPWPAIEQEIRQLGVVILTAADLPPLRRDSLAAVRSGFEQVDGLLSAATAGGLDMRALLFVALVGLALRQLWQGQVMVPAISLLWWAFDLVRAGAPPAADWADAGSD
ncbi:MAG: hypothetical protein RLZ44_1366 [Pseudomonadota bacterium]